MHRAAGFTIPAAGTCNGFLALEYRAGAPERLLFLCSQGLGGGHGVQVLPHLLHGAHAAEDHGNSLEGGGKAKSIAGLATAMELLQDSAGCAGQIGQGAALSLIHI